MKFPLLGLYQGLLILMGIALVGGGILLGISVGQPVRGEAFNIQAFAVTAAVVAAPGILFLVIAEIITVLLVIEDRGDKMYKLLNKQVKAEMYAANASEIASLPDEESPDPLTPEIDVPHVAATIRAQEATVRVKPKMLAQIATTYEKGRKVIVYWQTPNGDWVSLNHEGTLWVAEFTLKFEGDQNMLPLWDGK